MKYIFNKRAIFELYCKNKIESKVQIRTTHPGTPNDLFVSMDKMKKNIKYEYTIHCAGRRNYLINYFKRHLMVMGSGSC